MKLSDKMTAARAGTMEWAKGNYKFSAESTMMASEKGSLAPEKGSLVSGNSNLAKAYNRNLPTNLMEVYGNLYHGLNDPKKTGGSRTQEILYNESGKKMLNGVPRIQAINQYYSLDNTFIKETVQVAYQSKGEEFNLEEMTLEKFKSLKWLQGLPNTTIPLENKNFMVYMADYANNLLENYTEKKIKIFERGGWLQLNNGTYVYLDGEKNVIDLDRTIHTTSDIKLICDRNSFQNVSNFREFIQMREITKDNPAAVIIALYTIQSFFYSLYKKAGVTPKFLIALLGPSGSRKTSLAKAMTQFGNSNYSFWDTSAGLETAFPKHKDGVLLVDDLAPSTDTVRKSNMENNLELISRAFGDASKKNRNLDFCKDRGLQGLSYETCGGAMVTGEYYNGVQSSIARALRLEIRENTVDNALLSYYQKHKKIITTLLCSMIAYYSDNVEMLCGKLQKWVEDERTQYSQCFTNGRFAEYTAQLLAASCILLDYGTGLKLISQKEADDLSVYFRNVIVKVVTENSEALKVTAPIYVVCCSIIQYLQDNKSRECYLNEDQKLLYCKEDMLRDIFCGYCRDNDIEGLYYNKHALTKLLEQHNLIKPFMEGKTKRYSKKVGGSSGRYYVIDYNELLKIVRQ